MKTGWYDKSYVVTRPLHNGKHQQFVLEARPCGTTNYCIAAGVFPSNCTFKSYVSSPVWNTPTSSNKNPSFSILKIALDCLQEVEKEICAVAYGEPRRIIIDGFDEKRLRVYTKVLTKKEYGYRLYPLESDFCKLPKISKILK